MQQPTLRQGGVALPTRRTQTRTHVTEFTHGVDIAVDMAVAKAGRSPQDAAVELVCLAGPPTQG